MFVLQSAKQNGLITNTLTKIETIPVGYYRLDPFRWYYYTKVKKCRNISCSRKETVTLYVIMLVLQKLHNYGYYAKMMYHLFSVRPYRLSGMRVIPFRGSLMTVITIILQETGLKLFGDIFKNISQRWKISRPLDNYL